jgi:HrpA-like RNA helicase
VITVNQIHADEPLDGDILVFLTGQEEIEAIAQVLKEHADAIPKDGKQMEVGAISCEFDSEKSAHTLAICRCA